MSGSATPQDRVHTTSGRTAPGAALPPDGTGSLLLRGARLTAGRIADVRLQGGLIDAVGAPGTLPPAADQLDLDGYLLLPAPAEPHAHLDKALTAERAPNPSGDLGGAIAAWKRLAPTLTREDLVRRATEGALMNLANGATAIRSHVDTSSILGLRALEALVEVREALRGQVALQLVAMAGPDGADSRALLRDAMAAGADVVGGCPHLESDPLACTEACRSLAAELGRPLDLHTDETLDPDGFYLPDLADRVVATGFAHGVTASHCVSLGVQPPEVATRVAKRIAAAGIAVVCNPQTNLFLQARGRTQAPARGLTAVRALLDAGVVLAGGGDNLRDPFNAVGRGDPLETASLLVTAGHLTPEEAYHAVSGGARAAMGLPVVRVEAGCRAELLAVGATSLGEAVAGGGSRVVIHQGRVVSRTTITRAFGRVPATGG